jgi:uncharacterized protein YciI
MRGFVFRLIPPREDFMASMTDAERSTMVEHAQHWSRVAEQGSVVAFGPVDDPAWPYGIGIVLAEDRAAAEALMAGDPAPASPHGFRTELSPMVRLVTPTAQY